MRYFESTTCFIELIEWLFADEEKRNYLDHVPKSCRRCELLGICRDKNKDWQCYRGCMMQNIKRKK